MPAITIKSQEQWHALRKLHIGSSEAAALFNESPWSTRWQLYHEKRGSLSEVFAETTAMTGGRHLEPAIAAWAQDHFGLQLRKVRRYLQHDTVEGMGASLDYEEFGGGTLIPTEIKWSLWGDGWEVEGDDIVDAPLYYLMQVQHQLACMPGAPHGQIIAFLRSGLRRMIVPRRPKIITALEDEVEKFWAQVRDSVEPDADFAKDAVAIAALAYVNPLCQVDLSDDEDVARLAADHVRAKAREKAAAEEATEAKAAITKRLIDAAVAMGADVDEKKVVAEVGGYRISASKVEDSPGKIVTEDMIGTAIGTRKGYRLVSIREPKGKRRADAAAKADAVDLTQTESIF